MLRMLRLAAISMAVPLLLVGLAACGNDDDDDTGNGNGAQTVQITGVDYAFEGVPSTVAVGTTITFRNDSAVEAHELVAIRLPDDVDLSVEELLMLPEEELDELIPPGPPAMVIVALPNEDGVYVLGDGVLTEPGRYALLCFFPVGGDPDALAAALEDFDPDADDDEGPPDLGDGPPHAFEGMVAELTVE